MGKKTAGKKENLETYLNPYEFTQAFKEKVVLEVYYKGKDIHDAVKKYELPAYILLKCAYGNSKNSWNAGW